MQGERFFSPPSPEVAIARGSRFKSRGSLHCPGKPFPRGDRRSGLLSSPGRLLTFSFRKTLIPQE
ncbi:hypothetical protein [Oscillatoria acuminata]|uniref:hypothetical protein n=1 Tax=Oscillatoria acuminata TaxID=118323 RepID=UPI0012E9F26A|nr:hypothetical protein [Oscillatoria acuminata]